MKKKSKKAWGGRFAKPSNPLLESFNASLSFDRRLYREDIQGSIAHARMLKKIGILSKTELSKMERGLKSVLQEIEMGKFRWSDTLEDIHMAVESRLTDKVGSLGGKLHTGRSRNDQVALDMRLYSRRVAGEVVALITDLQKALVQFASKKGFVALPGYTHLQRAQPVLLAHHFLAYFEMLERDKSRFKDAIVRLNFSPLGSGALAGATYALDREFVAKTLSFEGVTLNSLDAVGDRDFVVELTFAMSLLMIHLSRFAEEMVLWSSQEFGFIRLPEEFCTGSSMMPQKVNPDVPELIRGKSGRVVGHLVGLLTVIKGLPLAYNKDLQEDKEPFFDSIDTVQTVLKILVSMVPGIGVNKVQTERALKEGFLLATDLADYLVTKKIPFRQAHEIVGHMIRFCIEKKKGLEDLSIRELQSFCPVIKSDVFGWLSVSASIDRRKTTGGTATREVHKQLLLAGKKLGMKV